MATAGDQINRALRLLGVLAEGESPSASTSQDALTALNQMIDSWNTERLSVFARTEQTVTWPADQATRTLGPSGNLPGTNVRPVVLDDATYFKDSSTGISYPVRVINQQQYDSISLKTVTSNYPQVILVNPTFPDITLTVYPVPTQALEWHFISVAVLTQPAALTTTLSFPPGYLRAFTYNLAMEIAPEFGVEPSPQVIRIASISKRNLKRINNPDDIMSLPSPIVTTRNSRFNVFAGNY